MKPLIRTILRLCLCIMMMCFVSGCVSTSARRADRLRYARFAAMSARQLKHPFLKAQLSYPPKDIALLIFKQSKTLELYGRDQHDWRYVMTFPIQAMSGGPGPKLHVGDHQVPEGMYDVVMMNPHSHFTLSMKLNYPNAFDRLVATTPATLGNNIFIHGKARSIGCIAIGDRAIEILYPLVRRVGLHHVRVIIAPNDLRRQPALPAVVNPKWLPILYQRIHHELASFPLHE